MIIPAYRCLATITGISVLVGIVFLFIIGALTLILADQQAEEHKVREELRHAKITMTVQREVIMEYQGRCKENYE